MSDQPVRVQLRRIKGWRMPPNTVKVDRSTKWGNPFVCHRRDNPDRQGCSEAMTGKPLDGEYCCLKTFREWVGSAIEGRDCRTGSVMAAIDATCGYLVRDAYVASIVELRDKNLACWCPLDVPCHADVLLEMANTPTGDA